MISLLVLYSSRLYRPARIMAARASAFLSFFLRRGLARFFVSFSIRPPSPGASLLLARRLFVYVRRSPPPPPPPPLLPPLLSRPRLLLDSRRPGGVPRYASRVIRLGETFAREAKLNPPNYANERTGSSGVGTNSRRGRTIERYINRVNRRRRSRAFLIRAGSAARPFS